jgi:predicted nuclease of restriction endonuclease-like RecB superfamily
LAAFDELPDLDGEDPRTVAGIRRVIEEWIDLRVEAALTPRRLREVAFDLGRMERDLNPTEALLREGSALGLERQVLREELYADVRLERRVRFPHGLSQPGEVISRYNFRLVQGLVFRAEKLTLGPRSGSTWIP